MGLHRYHITLRAPVDTAIEGHTLWGHLCWAILDTEGESALHAFLEAHAGPRPPVALGDAMPWDTLPRPLLPPLSPERRTALAEERSKAGADRTWAEMRDFKDAARIAALPTDVLRGLADGLTSEALIAHGLAEVRDRRRRLQAAPEAAAEARPWADAMTPHVSLSRFSGHALRGRLFAEETRHYAPRRDENGRPDPDLPQMTLWAHLDGFDPGRLLGLLRLVGLQGYGRNASVGRGRFDVADGGAVEWPVDAPNAAMALGAFAPGSEDPVEGSWDVRTHFGRVGNRLSSNRADAAGTPFKRPLLMLTAGSVLLHPNRPVFGRLVRNVHRRPDIVHGGFAPALPLRLAEVAREEGDAA